MKRISRHVGLGLAAAVLIAAARSLADSGTTPEFKEVQTLLLQHLAGATEAQLNQAAVKGLIAELKGRATLISDAGAPATNAARLVASKRDFDGNIGYIRVQRVEKGLGAAMASAAGGLMASNRMVGLVLDLRFAEGGDYAAAAAAVDLFLSDEMPLLNAGKGLISSKGKTNAMKLPVVALVNHETTGAAEALGAMLRQTGVGLLIGRRTAGRTGVTTDYELSTGQTLRVVTAPVQLGDAKAIPAEGITPDVEVAVKVEDEARYFENPFLRINGSAAEAAAPAGEDLSAHVRVTEADLVREKRGDGDVETLAGARVKAEERAPKVGDPALARAIDLLKGLSVVRQWKF